MLEIRKINTPQQIWINNPLEREIDTGYKMATKKRKIKYLKPQMEFNNALLGYEPKLPIKNSRNKKVEINWIMVILLLILMFALIFMVAVLSG